MNFERFYILVCQNWYRLPNQKQTILYLCYHYDLLIWKRNKLKLGAIVFVVKEYKFDEVLLWEDIEIKFIRQDTTLEDERKVEVILEKLKWEWNMKNYIGLFVVVLIALIRIWIFFKTQYCKRFPTLAYRSEHYDFIIRCGFESTFLQNSIGFFHDLSKINYWMINVLSDFCIYFNILL